MVINKYILKIFFLTLAINSLLVGGVSYAKFREQLKTQGLKYRNEIKAIRAECNYKLSEMECYVNSMSSRVKHLSADNKRLSHTGHRLSQQLENAEDIQKSDVKIIESKRLTNELAALDKEIIENYKLALGREGVILELESICNGEQRIDHLCENFEDDKIALAKYSNLLSNLATKRDVLLSKIARFESF